MNVNPELSFKNIKVPGPGHIEKRCGPYESFRSLVGERGWSRLAGNIRKRFADHGISKPVKYGGYMGEVNCSLIGWVFAQCARLIGTPLAPYRGRNVPTDVHVFKDNRTGGTVWERQYKFSGRKPVTVRSTKLFSGKQYLVELVGGGVGMKLNVFEEERKLHFRSICYFWRMGNIMIHIPDFLTPGTAHVVHTDEGDDCFRFTMTIRHSWFGTTFFQDGVFSEEWER